MIFRFGALALFAAALPLQAAAPPLPESDPGIEYPTVAAALQALRAKPGVQFTTENGWTIATDRPNLTIWSFAPEDNAAYPALVRRQIVEEGGVSSVKMGILCRGTKAACDDLARTFIELNQRAGQAAGRRPR